MSVSLRVLSKCMLLGLVLGGCANLHGPSLNQSTIVLPGLDADGLPKDKDVMHVVMQSANITTAVDPYCEGAGREFADDTVGAYLSGFLADLSDLEAKNAIEITTRSGFEPGYGAVWRVRLLIIQNYDEVFWSAGIDFLIEQSSRAVIPESFRCIGTG